VENCGLWFDFLTIMSTSSRQPSKKRRLSARSVMSKDVLSKKRRKSTQRGNDSSSSRKGRQKCVSGDGTAKENEELESSNVTTTPTDHLFPKGNRRRRIQSTGSSISTRSVSKSPLKRGGSRSAAVKNDSGRRKSVNEVDLRKNSRKENAKPRRRSLDQFARDMLLNPGKLSSSTTKNKNKKKSPLSTPLKLPKKVQASSSSSTTHNNNKKRSASTPLPKTKFQIEDLCSSSDSSNNNDRNSRSQGQINKEKENLLAKDPVSIRKQIYMMEEIESISSSSYLTSDDDEDNDINRDLKTRGKKQSKKVKKSTQSPQKFATHDKNQQKIRRKPSRKQKNDSSTVSRKRDKKRKSLRKKKTTKPISKAKKAAVAITTKTTTTATKGIPESKARQQEDIITISSSSDEEDGDKKKGATSHSVQKGKANGYHEKKLPEVSKSSIVAKPSKCKDTVSLNKNRHTDSTVVLPSQSARLDTTSKDKKRLVQKSHESNLVVTSNKNAMEEKAEAAAIRLENQSKVLLGKSNRREDKFGEVTLCSPGTQKGMSKKDDMTRNDTVSSSTTKQSNKLTTPQDRIIEPVGNNLVSCTAAISSSPMLNTPEVNTRSFLCWTCNLPLHKTSGKIGNSLKEKVIGDDGSMQVVGFCVYPHPLLYVTTCSPCADRAYAIEDDLEDIVDDDIFCSWCAGDAEVENDRDSDLLLCDSCPRAFCKRCTALAHGGGDGGLKMVQKLESDSGPWSCLHCEPPYALRCMQEFLRDNISEETVSKEGSIPELVTGSKSVSNEKFDTVEELIRDLTNAEDKLDEAEQMLEDESIERQKSEIRKEVMEHLSKAYQHIDESAVLGDQIVEDDLATFVRQWKDHHARCADIIGTTQDLLEDKGVNLSKFYEERSTLNHKKSVPNNSKELADAELDERDKKDGILKGFDRLGYGWAGEKSNYRDLEDLTTSELNEVEEINTTDDTVAKLKEISKRKGFDFVVAKFLSKALPSDDTDLSNLNVNITERQSTETTDKELEQQQRAKDYFQRKTGNYGTSGRIVLRDVELLAKKKRMSSSAYIQNSTKSIEIDKSIISSKNKTGQRKRITPQLIVDPSNDLQRFRTQIPIEGNDIPFENSDLVMATLPFSNGIITIAEPLTKVLKAHQKDGVKFMWERVCSDIPLVVGGSQVNSPKQVQGCILAHNMGLGKSLQTIALLHTLLIHPLLVQQSFNSSWRIINHVLLVVPVNALENWKAEFNTWVGNQLNLFSLNDSSHTARLNLIENWMRSGGVLLSSPDTFARMCKRIDETTIGNLIKNAFISPGPDIVILDEAHLMLKNSKSDISKALSSMRTSRRISLSGTPIQNDLLDYFRMANWIKPNCLGTEAEFKRKYCGDIMSSMNTDSSNEVVRSGEILVQEIWDTLAPFVQRLDSSVLAKDLPHMQQVVIHVRQSKIQAKLYRAFQNYQRKAETNNFFDRYSKLFPVNNHPGCLLLRSTPSENSIQDSHSDEPTSEVTEKWWEKVYKKNTKKISEINSGGKVVLLLQIVAHSNFIGDKVVVFSQCLKTLDYIEKVLNFPDWGRKIPYIQNLDPCKQWGGWKKNVDYLRIDGSTSATERGELINNFNEDPKLKSIEENSKLFLISSKAGGIGINLVAANRVILFDSNWNPAVDLQALYRCYRYGQTKPVYAYRFLTEGTMEEKVYSRQVNKTNLSARVVDHLMPERTFTSQELSDIMKLDTWVQCDRCDKWRMLSMYEDVENLPDKWFCEMNTYDKARSHCSAKERSKEWYVNFWLQQMDGTTSGVTNEGTSLGQESLDVKEDSSKLEKTKRDLILTRLLAFKKEVSSDEEKDVKDKTSPSSLISKYYFDDRLLKVNCDIAGENKPG